MHVIMKNRIKLFPLFDYIINVMNYPWKHGEEIKRRVIKEKQKNPYKENMKEKLIDKTKNKPFYMVDYIQINKFWINMYFLFT